LISWLFLFVKRRSGAVHIWKKAFLDANELVVWVKDVRIKYFRRQALRNFLIESGPTDRDITSIQSIYGVML